MEILSATKHEWLRHKASEIFHKYSLPKWFVFTIDNFLVFSCFLTAYLLRFSFRIDEFSISLALSHAILALAVYGGFSLLFRYYSDILRHTTIVDLLSIFFSTTISFILLLGLSLVGRLVNLVSFFVLPLSVIIIHYILITTVLFLVRISVKIAYYFVTASFFPKKRVVIFGANTTGVAVKRVLTSDAQGGFQVVGFLDNNKSLLGKKINGIQVFNPEVLTPEFISRYSINTLVFAMNDLPVDEKSKIIRSTLKTGIEILETPAVDKWLNGQLKIQQIRKVQLQDLLGRQPIRLNMKRIGMGLSDKTILVTGAAGSIGSEIVRLLTRFKIRNLILVDQAETPMFHLENEIRAMEGCFTIKTILADVTNKEKIELIFKKYHPEIVFHAAAYKHVPLMESNPHEAIRVNVGGTKNLTDLSVKYGVRKFVMISTDKAVNPTNVMGASKRICEMIVQMKANQVGHKTQFVTTRFGNVLGSNGSVIPIFRKQIEEGGPVTVTHPEITRYFMTIPEACELVMEAGFMGNGGEIFVFDMGDPVKIVDLARHMIQLSGFVPDRDIEIVFTGLRPGEKLYEELLTDQENTLPTYHPKIKIGRCEIFDHEIFMVEIERILSRVYQLTNMEIIDFCKRLVPEFSSSNKRYNLAQSLHNKLKEPDHRELVP